MSEIFKKSYPLEREEIVTRIKEQVETVDELRLELCDITPRTRSLIEDIRRYDYTIAVLNNILHDIADDCYSNYRKNKKEAVK